MSGLRLGDPLSPVFFLLVVDALSRIISKGVVSNDLECLKIDTDNLPSVIFSWLYHFLLLRK